MYVNENGNGKKPLALLGEIATDFLGATIPNPLLASAFRVASRRQLLGSITAGSWTIGGAAPKVAPTPAPVPVLTPVPVPVAPKPIPLINIVTLPNGTAVPSAILPAPAPLNGGSPAPSAPVYYGADPGYTGTQGGSRGSSFGPPPVEVGTLPDGDSTGGGGGGNFALAGMAPNSPMLLLAAVAAFFLLGDNKRKRRR